VLDVDVSERTTSCLDFDVILRALRERAVTVLGKNLSGLQAATSAAECVTNYARVEQMFASLEYFPLRTDMNVEPLLRTIEMNSSPPEKRDLAKFSENIETIEELLLYFEENKERLNLLLDLSSRMKLPNELLSVFTNAFDDEGNLNGEKYPEIMRLRKEISSFKSRILQIIQSLLKSQDMKEKLADSGYTEIEGRFCLMLKNTYKKGVGVVHGSSNTGRTMYVEPQEVVELTNEMKGFQGQLRAEENRILFEMCRCIAAHLDEIRESVKAVAEIDVVRAKAMLGKTLGGVIPEVHDEGCIRCLDAKHPVLMLRGTDPVGNKVELSESATALVISGPNAGGKTIVLKTAGLFALMAKHAIPISAKAGARIDMFEVMADIGDMQTVSGDLSTFSGHLVVCRNILTKVKEHSERGGKSLVLFDEIGTGTDPAQGAALAQAVLEELLLLGSRVIVTTHYQRIKELAAENSRFQIAAMEFVENRPTYRLRLGSVGESFALEAGRRMNLPEAVLERANCLLDDESRRIVALQLRLEQETERARLLQVELQGQIKGLEAREAGIEASKVELEQQLEKVRQGKTDEFLSELRNKEKELIILLKRINDMAVITSSATPVTPAAKAEREKAIEETIAAVKSLKTVTEKEQVEQSAEDLATPLVPGEPIEEGTTLIILERGHIFGSRGIVTQRNKGRGRVLLRVAGVEVKMERHLLGVPHKSGKMGFVVNGLDPDAASELSSKDRRLMKMLQEDLVDPGKIVRLGGGSSSQKRTSANTLDVRTHQEKGLDHVQVVVSQFIERLVNEGATAGYLQHGSTKDTSSKSTKEKVRQWLKRNPLIIKCGPAPLSEGADSFTLLELVDDE
jgi:DNA mismatch repair protein MutS2